MSASASILPISKREIGVNLLFYSTDEKRAQRLAARLRLLANVIWEDSRHFRTEPWTQGTEPPRLVLLDYAPEMVAVSNALIQRIRASHPDTLLVGVGSTSADHAAGVLSALRSGVRDFLDMDANDQEISEQLRRLLEHTLSGQQPATAEHKQGRLILLLGVRAGMGCSTLAAHLGALVMQPPGKLKAPFETATSQTLLLDLGQPQSDAALYLGVAGDFHYHDALRHAARIDPVLIRTALPHHSSQLAVLSRASVPSPAPESDTGLLIRRLRDFFGLVLCDVGGLSMTQIPKELLDAAEQIWLIADQSIGALVSLDACLHELDRLQLRDQRLSLVINRYDRDGGIDRKQLAARFNLPIPITLPERSHALRTSANQGLLLHDVAPHDPYIKALAPLLDKLRPPSQRAPRPPLWHRLIPPRRGH